MSNKHQKSPSGISTELSLSSNASLTEEFYNYYVKEHNKLPTMKHNQLSIYGIDFSRNKQQEIVVKSFIRSTIEKPVRLKSSPIVLIDQDGDLLSRVIVDFTDLGVLSPNTSRPWTFTFPKETIQKQNVDERTDWSLAFDSPTKHRLDLSDMEKSKISKSSKGNLEKIIDQVPLEQEELSFMGLSAKHSDSGELITTLLIRNGTSSDLRLTQLPLKLYDAQGSLCAEGTFEFSNLTITANTSKPITLVYPESSITKKTMDLSRISIQHVE